MLTLVLLAASASPVLAQTAPLASDTELAPPPERDHGVRPRYGFSIGALGAGGEAQRRGTFGSNEGVVPAFGGELQGRIGVQIEDHVAVYYQGTFAAGHEVCVAVWPHSECPPTNDALYLHASSLVVDFTFARGMQVGVGGSIVAALFDTVHPSTEIHYGWLARVGWAFGGDGPGDRNGFTIGIQANVSIATGDIPGPLVDIALSLGWESF